MTLIEVLQVVLAVVGVALGVALGRPHGWLGALLGLVLGVGFMPALALTLIGMHNTWQRLIRAKPYCVRGACDANGYHSVRREGDGEVFACRCGDTYKLFGPKAGASRRFVRLVEGHACPYMIRQGRRWVADDGTSGSPYR